MDGEGLDKLKAYYGGTLPAPRPLYEVKEKLDKQDVQYLGESRPSQTNAEDDLAFFYQHKDAMEVILAEQKRRDIHAAGIALGDRDRITASLRRPFKKGARELGGSSR